MKKTALLILTGVLFLFFIGADIKLFGRGDTVSMTDPSGVVKSHTLIYMEGKIMFEEIIALAKAMGHFRTAIDAIVCNSPAVVFDVSLVGGTGGASTAIIYNGNSTAGTRKIDLAAVTSTTDRAGFWPGMFFANGIYIDVGSNVTSVTILYLPVKE